MSRNPTEHVQEEITHHASHEAGGRWITAAATTAAIIAAFAAAAGALATRHETQSTLIRIKANDDWSYYQAKSIKSSLLEAKIYTAQINHLAPRQADVDKRAQYSEDMPKIQVGAKQLEKLSRRHLETHEAFEGAATLFHIAIAIVAIAVVARRKEFWYISVVVGIAGVLLFGKAVIQSPPGLKEEEEEVGPAHKETKSKPGEEQVSSVAAEPGSKSEETPKGEP